MCINTWWGKKDKDNGVRMLSVGISKRIKGSDQKLKYREIWLNRKKLFFDVHGQTLSQVVQRGWRVSSLGDIQNLIEHIHSWSNCSHWPCYEKGVGWGALQMCIPASAILRFCGQLNYKHKSFECREGQWQLISHVGFISHQVLCLLTAAHTEFLTFFLYKIQPIPCKWWNLAIS